MGALETVDSGNVGKRAADSPGKRLERQTATRERQFGLKWSRGSSPKRDGVETRDSSPARPSSKKADAGQQPVHQSRNLISSVKQNSKEVVSVKNKPQQIFRETPLPETSRRINEQSPANFKGKASDGVVQLHELFKKEFIEKLAEKAKQRPGYVQANEHAVKKVKAQPELFKETISLDVGRVNAFIGSQKRDSLERRVRVIEPRSIRKPRSGSQEKKGSSPLQEKFSDPVWMSKCEKLNLNHHCKQDAKQTSKAFILTRFFQTPIKVVPPTYGYEIYVANEAMSPQVHSSPRNFRSTTHNVAQKMENSREQLLTDGEVKNLGQMTAESTTGRGAHVLDEDRMPGGRNPEIGREVVSILSRSLGGRFSSDESGKDSLGSSTRSIGSRFSGKDLSSRNHKPNGSTISPNDSQIKMVIQSEPPVIKADVGLVKDGEYDKISQPQVPSSNSKEEVMLRSLKRAAAVDEAHFLRALQENGAVQSSTPIRKVCKLEGPGHGDGHDALLQRRSSRSPNRTRNHNLLEATGKCAVDAGRDVPREARSREAVVADHRKASVPASSLTHSTRTASPRRQDSLDRPYEAAVPDHRRPSVAASSSTHSPRTASPRRQHILDHGSREGAVDPDHRKAPVATSSSTHSTRTASPRRQHSLDGSCEAAVPDHRRAPVAASSSTNSTRTASPRRQHGVDGSCQAPVADHRKASAASTLTPSTRTASPRRQHSLDGSSETTVPDHRRASVAASSSTNSTRTASPRRQHSLDHASCEATITHHRKASAAASSSTNSTHTASPRRQHSLDHGSCEATITDHRKASVAALSSTSSTRTASPRRQHCLDGSCEASVPDHRRTSVAASSSIHSTRTASPRRQHGLDHESSEAAVPDYRKASVAASSTMHSTRTSSPRRQQSLDGSCQAAVADHRKAFVAALSSTHSTRTASPRRQLSVDGSSEKRSSQNNGGEIQRNNSKERLPQSREQKTTVSNPSRDSPGRSRQSTHRSSIASDDSQSSSGGSIIQKLIRKVGLRSSVSSPGNLDTISSRVPASPNSRSQTPRSSSPESKAGLRRVLSFAESTTDVRKQPSESKRQCGACSTASTGLPRRSFTEPKVSEDLPRLLSKSKSWSSRVNPVSEQSEEPTATAQQDPLIDNKSLRVNVHVRANTVAWHKSGDSQKVQETIVESCRRVAKPEQTLSAISSGESPSSPGSDDSGSDVAQAAVESSCPIAKPEQTLSAISCGGSPWSPGSDDSGSEASGIEQPSPVSVLLCSNGRTPFQGDSRLGPLEHKLQELHERIHKSKTEVSNQKKANLEKIKAARELESRGSVVTKLETTELQPVKVSKAPQVLRVPADLEAKKQLAVATFVTRDKKVHKARLAGPRSDFCTTLETFDLQSVASRTEEQKWDLAYVRDVLVASNFGRDKSMMTKWHSVTEPMDPYLFEKLEDFYINGKKFSGSQFLSSVAGIQEDYPRMQDHIRSVYYSPATMHRGTIDAMKRCHLFDVVNETLAKKLVPYVAPPRPWMKTLTKPVLRPRPTGSELLQEIWAEICDQVGNNGSMAMDKAQLHRSLEDLISTDLYKRTPLFPSREVERAAERIGLELERRIFDDLLKETITSLLSSR